MDERLKKEAEQLISQGYTEPQIKQFLTEKGYSIKDIDEALRAPIPKKKENNEKVWIVIGVFIGIVIISLSILIYIQSQPKLIKYTDNPSDWIVDNKNGTKSVDINLVSSGKSFIDSQGQQYRSGDIKTMFSSYGYYQGNYFDKNYDNLMSIDTNMNPNDGIIEGYAVFDIVNDSPTFYIFVDEDWKQKVTPTTIFYGFDHSKNKTFEFNEVSKGIYMDTIVDDKENYDTKYQMHIGSILIGDITHEKIDSKSENLTMIVIK